MRVRVLSIEGCGGAEDTVRLVKETASDMGIVIEFDYIIIRTQDDARTHRHIGSPTVQINGLDIEPEARTVQRFGLT